MENETESPVEGELLEADELVSADAVPLCLNCMRPAEAGRHYCAHCGEGTGTFTPNIPYVNIRYNSRIFGRVWRGVRYEKPSAGMWVISIFMLLPLIILFAPIMLISLPFMLWGKRKAKKV